MLVCPVPWDLNYSSLFMKCAWNFLAMFSLPTEFIQSSHYLRDDICRFFLWFSVIFPFECAMKFLYWSKYLRIDVERFWWFNLFVIKNYKLNYLKFGFDLLWFLNLYESSFEHTTSCQFLKKKTFRASFMQICRIDLSGKMR